MRLEACGSNIKAVQSKMTGIYIGGNGRRSLIPVADPFCKMAAMAVYGNI